jgi:hypothetical protein
MTKVFTSVKLFPSLQSFLTSVLLLHPFYLSVLFSLILPFCPSLPSLILKIFYVPGLCEFTCNEKYNLCYFVPCCHVFPDFLSYESTEFAQLLTFHVLVPKYSVK